MLLCRPVYKTKKKGWHMSLAFASNLLLLKMSDSEIQEQPAINIKVIIPLKWISLYCHEPSSSRPFNCILHLTTRVDINHKHRVLREVCVTTIVIVDGILVFQLGTDAGVGILCNSRRMPAASVKKAVGCKSAVGDKSISKNNTLCPVCPLCLRQLTPKC